MELLCRATGTQRTPIEVQRIPTESQRIPTATSGTAIDVARAAIEFQRTATDRARAPCRNVWTAIVAQRLAFWRARVARRAKRPARRTAARKSEPRNVWPDLSNGARAERVVLTPWPPLLSGEGEPRKEGVVNALLRRRLEMAGRV